MIYEENTKKLLKYVCLEDSEEGRAEFERRMSMLSETSRRAILISWGLTPESNIACPPYYNRLNKKLGMEESSSSEIYNRAIKELCRFRFADILIDRYKFDSKLVHVSYNTS